MATPLKAPFPYFGGKSRIAPLVWKRLGAVMNYVEPFAGSLAILLRRPPGCRGTETVNDVTGAVTNAWRATTPTRGDPAAVADAALDVTETVNDLDPYLANVWRAIRQDPAGVVEHCDQPVNELDLHAMHRWLVLGEGAVEFRDRMRADPFYFDVWRAGFWIAGVCEWIGGGWCAYKDGVGRRPRIANTDTRNGGGLGAHGAGPSPKRPVLTGGEPGALSKGVHAAGDAGQSQQIPMLSAPGCGMDAAPGEAGGLSQQIPHMDSSRGMDAARAAGGRPQLADAFDIGRGVHSCGVLGTCAERRAWLLDWFGALRDRLRLVRVCCGHWLRVCDSPSVTTRLGTTGVFLDPPYRTRLADGSHNRDGGLYAVDDDPDRVVDEVIAYCLERGTDPMMRIAVCGYEGEGYEALEKVGWEVVAWKTSGGYSNQGKSAKGKTNNNAARERVWFSPHCDRERTLFDGMVAGVEDDAADDATDDATEETAP